MAIPLKKQGFRGTTDLIPPKYYGYLRVSTEGQEVESQKLGLFEYANRNGFTNVEIVSEKISRATAWRERKLGSLLDMAGKGDVILTPEFTRLAESPGQVFSFLEAAAKKGVAVHVTRTNTVMDSSLQSQLLASAFSMASMIELEFISSRTKEGLQRAKLEGKRLGRPPGKQGSLRLDKKIGVVQEYLDLRLSKRKMAKALGVAYSTLDEFIEKKGLRQFKGT